MINRIFLLGILCFVEYECKKGYNLVIDGDKSESLWFPHSALLSMICEQNAYTCGGTVINQRLILTAAHCLYECNPSNIAIRVGSVNSELAKVVGCLNYRIHECYDPAKTLSIVNDIAIMFASEDFVFGPTLKRVMLTDNPPKFNYGYVGGWGMTVEGVYQPSSDLRFTRQRLLSREACIQNLPYPFGDGVICAKTQQNDKYIGYPALGDSGNGLIVGGFIQIGIVSYKQNIDDNSITLYTYTPYFYNWIEKISHELYCQIKTYMPCNE